MNLQLPDQYVDIICQALGEIPWRVANPIMQMIVDQANNGQLNPQPQVTENKPE